MTARAEQVVVVGAGPAGLAAAGALGQRGVEALVVDAADEVAASWRRRYERLRLNTTRRLSSLPGAPMDARFGRWVGSLDYAAYLENYARTHVSRLELGVRVDALTRESGGWRLDTTRGPIATRAVVLATGFDRVPKLPDWPGRERFRGHLLHSSEYRSARPFRGLDVLVVGAGTSGNEIAVHLLDAGARSVRVSIRTRQTTFPRELLGVPLGTLAHLRPRPPARVTDAMGRLLERAIWGDLRKLGLEPPPLGMATSTERTGHGIAVDSGLVDALRVGRAEAVAAVEALEEDAVVLAGGRRLRVDAVIAATGYRQGLEELLGHLPGVLRPDGRPAIAGAETVPAAPRLYCLGFRLPVSGQLPELRRDAKAIARAVAEPRRQARRLPSRRAWAAISPANVVKSRA